MGGLKEALDAIEKFIPGLSEYKEKELLREEDLALRRYLAEVLDQSLKDLREVEKYAVMTSGLDPTIFEEQVVQRLESLLREIESAEAGYAGWLDQVQVREDKLEAVLENDRELLERATNLRDRAKEVLQSTMSGQALDIMGFTSMINEIRDLLERRKAILLGGGE